MDPEFEPARQRIVTVTSAKRPRKRKSSSPKRQTSAEFIDLMKKSAEREAFFIAEMSRLKGSVERFRIETAELRRESEMTIREIEEERNLARLRIARLEELTRFRRQTMWQRIKNAFGVLLGETQAIPRLPAPRPELKKAA